MIDTNNTKQAAWVGIGSLFSFIVGIVSPMILSRFFDKADYGTYKQVMYVYNTLLVVFTFGLPRAYSYFLPKRNVEEAKSIITKLNKIFIVLGFIFSLILFIFASPIAKILNNEELTYALRVFSPVPVLLLPTMGLEGILATYKKTGYLAVFTIITRSFTVLCTVIPVIFYSGTYIHAIIGFDIAAIITCSLAFYLMGVPIKGIISKKTDLSYKEIFSFSFPLLTASLWGMIIGSAPQFYISRYYGNEVFADFSNGFMRFPIVEMVTASIATVLLPEFSRIDKGNGMNEDAIAIWNNTILKSAKIIFPMIIFCVFFAGLFMICMYGDMYSTSAVYFQIKNLSGLFYIVPFSPIMIAIGKTSEYSYYHLLTAVLTVILGFIAVRWFGSPINIAIVTELCFILLIILMMGSIMRYARKSFLSLVPLKTLLNILLASIISGVMTYLFCSYLPINKYVVLLIAFFIYVTLYYILCWLFKISYKNILESFLGSNHILIMKFIP